MLRKLRLPEPKAIALNQLEGNREEFDTPYIAVAKRLLISKKQSSEGLLQIRFSYSDTTEVNKNFLILN
ncbi:MAG: hypothetical protein RMY28_037665 [Nostoc sp. ChiSLP01]|nr:hypothetical protein [Nostoc sp. ChiSLP01]